MTETAAPLHRPGRGCLPGELPSAAVRQAAETARRDAPAARHARRLTAATADSLTAAGFAGHFVPRDRGGAEGTFGDLLEASVTVGEQCASAAWCATLWAAHARFAALLPEEGQKEIWSESPHARIAAVLMPPSGAATRTEDGWLVQGEWPLASGVDHADWVLLAATETAVLRRPARAGASDRPLTTESGQHAVRVFAVPRAAVLVRDTWNSAGLSATGTNTVVLAEPTAVPARRSMSLATLLAGETREGAARCHAAPAHLAGGVLFCGPALGAARRALARCAEWARTAGPGGVRPLERASVRERIARSAAEIEAVGLLLREAARRADYEPVTPGSVARNRRDTSVAADWLATAVDRLLRTGGAHLRDPDGVLYRAWADVLTVASHGSLRLEPAAEAYASSLDDPEAVDA
ncbi:acyl-CoA dehydrogenase family protein [Streptomyces sp. GC420]|uniref:acyl-CoA dehydrogenase family protein n=1 Tax=Streptomyces sp. GC420 TaxID=2697568 RepID=UPI001414CF2F|nr:acyl-CoA dehydrogenase family protein [Streptomyces sp. GC420]NBM18022.1 oxidoreductase [Streptomyces sp. GC420]